MGLAYVQRIWKTKDIFIRNQFSESVAWSYCELEVLKDTDEKKRQVGTRSAMAEAEVARCRAINAWD